jgi:hypothetical protein
MTATSPPSGIGPLFEFVNEERHQAGTKIGSYRATSASNNDKPLLKIVEGEGITDTASHLGFVACEFLKFDEAGSDTRLANLITGELNMTIDRSQRSFSR